MFLIELINVQMIITSLRFRAGKYAYQSHVWEHELKSLNLHPQNVQKIRKVETRSKLSTESLTLMNVQSLKDGFIVGVEVMIRGLSEACRTLALRVLSCFYLVAVVISAHEGAYHQSPLHHSLSPPYQERQFIFMTETSF